MSKLVRACAFAALTLGLCLLLTPVTRGDDDDDDKEDIKEASKATAALKNLIDGIEARKDIAKLKDDLNTTTDLKHIMWAGFKTRAKGGIGVGPKAGAIIPDGVEAKIIAMSKKPMPAQQLDKESADLIRLAQTVQAIAEIAEMHNSKKALGWKTAGWMKYNKLQKDAAQDLEFAVKSRDPDKVQEAVKTLYSSCTKCHAMLRLPPIWLVIVG